MAKADKYFTGAETGDFSEVYATTGTISVSSAVKRTGGYSYRINPAAAAQGYLSIWPLKADGTMDASGTTVFGTNVYITFWVRFAGSIPAVSTDQEILRADITGSTNVLRVTFNSSGHIKAQNGASTVYTASCGTVVADTWYRIDVRRTTSDDLIGIRLNGGTEQTVANTSFQDFDVVEVKFGVQSTASVAVDINIDDIVIGTTALDAGAGPCVRLSVPIGDGNYAYNWFDGSSTGYQAVDEVPHNSDTDYVRDGADQNQAETFAMQTAATTGIAGTIYAVKSCAIVRDEGGASLVSARLRSSTTDNDTTAVDPGSTYRALQKVYTTDPADAAAWTGTKFDGLEGGVNKGAAAASVRCTAVYLIVCEDGVATVQTITPSGIASAEAFGTAKLNRTVLPSAIASLQAFGSLTLLKGNVNVSPSAIASLQAFGSPTLLKGNVNVSPSAIASLEAFGTAKVNLTVIAQAIASLEAFGSAAVLPGGVSVLPGGIASAEVFGTLEVLQLTTILVDGIASLESFGTPFLIFDQFVDPGGIASLEAFGSVIIIQDQFVLPAGIASLEAFGGHLVWAGGVTVVAQAIASLEAFGSPVIALATYLVLPSGIASLEAFGSATITVSGAVVIPDGIASAEAFGAATVIPGVVSVAPSAIASAEAFGSPILVKYVSPTGITSLEVFGTPSLALGGVTIIVTGIDSAEAFGGARVVFAITGFRRPQAGESRQPTRPPAGQSRQPTRPLAGFASGAARPGSGVSG